MIGSSVTPRHRHCVFVSSSPKRGKASKAPSHSLLSEGAPSQFFQTLSLRRGAAYSKPT